MPYLALPDRPALAVVRRVRHLVHHEIGEAALATEVLGRDEAHRFLTELEDGRCVLDEQICVEAGEV